MSRVHITYAVDPHHLDGVKKSASKHLPAVSPSLRMEILARALGFNTWAGMKASNPVRREIDVDAALTFAGARGVSIEPLDLHRAMVDATLMRIASEAPELHWHGIHEVYFSPSPEERDAIQQKVPSGSLFKEVNRIRRESFEESRARLLKSDQADQLLRALALLTLLTPTKTVSYRSRSSYGIKHVAERMSFDLGGGVILAPQYVSNVDAIIAALDLGFPIKHEGGKSPNVAIGITIASLRAVQDEQKRRKQSA